MNKNDDPHRYDDIIGLPHHQSTKRAHMPLADRAAQFSPFAALTGHSDAIRETARLTDVRLELDEEEKVHLNSRLAFVMEHIEERPEISLTYFLPDEHKEGGAYVTISGAVKKVDDFERTVVMVDGTVIPIEGVVAIEGVFFGRMNINIDT